MTQNKLTILGSGTSTGTPIVGCQCAVCQSTNPHDQRLRSALYLETQNQKHILIDATPDLRYQLLRSKISYLDFVIITHEHADHIHGMDDLRAICFLKNNHELDVYCADFQHQYLTERFPYIFNKDKVFSKDRPIIGGGIPSLNLKKIHLKQSLTPLNIMSENFTFFLLPHNYTKTLGFYHDGFAYLPDCHEIHKDIVDFLKLKKPDLLIINCLQKEDHQTHLTVSKSFDYIKQINPKRAGLIHMNHNLGHTELTHLAKENFDFPVFPVYDTQNFIY